MTLAEKYDTTRTWTEKCHVCGTEIEMCAATWEVIGPYCEGCMGWPVCCCRVRHTGNCKPSVEVKP